MKTKKNNQFREIVVFVAGTTPQILTETVYGLIHLYPPVIPDEICILTTLQGARTIRTQLIEPGLFAGFCSEFKLDPALLTEDSIIVIKDINGHDLSDIKGSKDNECMGDVINQYIRELSNDKKVRLHCCLAGGRKTMSFYLGAALQLYGRPWDSLYHVLVSPEFESHPEFYYKPKKNRKLTNKGRQLNTDDAVISLAELPFIRLRETLSLDGQTFRQAVQAGQKDIDTAFVQPSLKVSIRQQTITVGGRSIRLTPMQIMVYSAYLRYKTQRCKYPERLYCRECTDCFPSLLDLTTKAALEEMAKDYMAISPSRAEDLLYKYQDGLPMDVLRQVISKIKRVLQEQLRDETLESYYAITTAQRSYANTRHGVRVEKGKIRIE